MIPLYILITGYETVNIFPTSAKMRGDPDTALAASSRYNK
jgi:hypothetical protein